MDPANVTEATDKEDGDRVPSRTPLSPGRSDPYANTRVWQPTRSNMPGESLLHVADGAGSSFPTPTSRLKLSHLSKRTRGTILPVEEIRSRRAETLARGAGAGPQRTPPRVRDIPTPTRPVGGRRRTRPRIPLPTHTKNLCQGSSLAVG
jgi:hypothetical protein